MCLSALAVGLCACTDLPAAPMVGTGGAGGSGGADGGVGDCASIVPARTPDLEDDDGLSGDFAVGKVSAATDSFDRWSIGPCAGRVDLLLTWNAMERGLDLDLVLFDSAGELDAARNPVPGHETEELAGVNLDTGEQLFVEVQAIHTTGVTDLSYSLGVTQRD